MRYEGLLFFFRVVNKEIFEQGGCKFQDRDTSHKTEEKHEKLRSKMMKKARQDIMLTQVSRKKNPPNPSLAFAPSQLS